MRKRYRQLKDSPEWRAGSIFEEACDDGTQPFICIEAAKGSILGTERHTFHGRETVTKQPEWFEEIVPLYIPAAMIKKVDEFIKTLAKEKK